MASATVPGGERNMERAFGLEAVDAPSVGELACADYTLDAELCRCEYRSLETASYQLSWGSYWYACGLDYAIRSEEPAVSLFLQLEGTGERVASERGVTRDVRAGHANLAVLPAMSTRFEATRDVAGASFEITLSARYFTELAARHAGSLDDLADAVQANRFALLAPDHVAITAEMRALTQRVQRAPESGAAASLLIESAITHLLALMLARPPAPVTPDGVRLTRRDIEALHATRARLLARLDAAPSLAELAHHAAMNEFKLKRGFRALFGSSPYAYFLQHRLERAREYLLDTDWPVARIARTLGYRDPSHFTNAFRGRYGTTPRQLRRDGRAGGARVTVPGEDERQRLR